MAALDTSLMERAEPHFLDAIATFGVLGDDLVRIVQDITQAGKMAGFTKHGRRKMLDYLYAYIEKLERRAIDPFSRGQRVNDPSSLFSSDRLGGLFNDPFADQKPPQADLFGSSGEQHPEERALIDRLIAETRLYTNSAEFDAMVQFVARLRDFAPFNAMLLHIQKPGLTHAATARDWFGRFRRRPKRHARPLVVLRNFGPVDFVFDVQDTEGRELPADAFAFPTKGDVMPWEIVEIQRRLHSKEIETETIDVGDAHAGYIKLLEKSSSDNERNLYRLAFNRNHTPPTQFVTIAHELAHLFLGHLGADRKRRIRDRRGRSHAVIEVEAETAAYLVARRNGVEPRSQTYLHNFQGGFAELDPYAMMRAVGEIERMMGWRGTDHGVGGHGHG